jgi:GNAT superfamily N-acetyltransferase
MNIRKAVLDDHKDICKVLQHPGRSQTDENVYHNLATILENNQADLYVYDLSGTVVAFISMVFFTGLTSSSASLRITDFVVHINYQGLGIGKEMLSFTEYLAREKGYSYLEWHSDSEHPMHHRFALHHGFCKSYGSFLKNIQPHLIPSSFII